MTAPKLTSTEFLLARLGEDEVGAKHIVPEEHWPSLRSLRDVEAKRRVVEASEHHARYDDGALGDHCRANLSLLAAVYSDHADYDEAWRT